MGERVIVVEPEPATALAIASLLESFGCRVVVASSAADACRHPQRFDCGVFSDQLPDEGGMALAGWLLAQDRVRVAVFYGHDPDVSVRLRASNLGTYVPRCDGLGALANAALEALGETRLARAVGAESDEPRLELKTGSRRRA